MRQRTLLIWSLVLIVVGVVGIIVVAALGPSLRGRSATSGGTTSATGAATIGRSIYLTGVGSDGTDIPRSSTTMRGMMARQGCATCHETDGRGGTIPVAGGGTIEVPDIRYSTLQDEGFDDTTIARAIRDGLDEKGGRLDLMMPRWNMSNTDMQYLIAYLKELSNQ